MAKIFNVLKNLLSFNKTTEKINTEYYADYNPLSYGAQTLTIEEMLGLTYITRSIQMIANDVAKTTWAHYKWDGKKIRKTLQINSAKNWLLNRKPNSEMTAYEFKKMIVWNIFLYGKAPIYCLYEKINGKDTLIEMIPIYPEIVQQVRDPKTGKIKYQIESNNENIELQENELIYISYESIINVNNVSMKALFKSTFDKLKENEKAIYNAVKNDLGVSMIIDIPDITDKEATQKVQESVTQMIKMQKQYGSIAFVKDKRWSISDKTSIIKSNIDYNTRNAIAREVAATFGIPPSKLGIEDNNKYNTMVERNRSYSDEAIKPVLLRITTAFTNYFFPNTMTEEITFRAIDLLSIDPNSLKDFASSAINNGWATPNEIRSLVGFEALENGDQLMANSAIIPIDLTIKKLKLEIKNMKKGELESKPVNEESVDENNENDKNAK